MTEWICVSPSHNSTRITCHIAHDKQWHASWPCCPHMCFHHKRNGDFDMKVVTFALFWYRFSYKKMSLVKKSAHQKHLKKKCRVFWLLFCCLFKYQLNWQWYEPKKVIDFSLEYCRLLTKNVVFVEKLPQAFIKDGVVRGTI